MRTTSHTIRALGFLHNEGYEAARDLATVFAGSHGRIATMEDIIDARLASPIGTTAWNTLYVTNSRLYLGLSTHGEPLIAITHGNGPLGSNKKHWACEHNEWPYYTNGTEKISHAEFIQLLHGAYGPRTIISLNEYLKNPAQNSRALENEYTSERACEDKLLRAIFGQRAEEFFVRHRAETHAWLNGYAPVKEIENSMTIRNMIFFSYQDWNKELSDDRRAAHVYPLALSAAYFSTEREEPKHILGYTEIYCSSKADFMGPAPVVVGIRGKEPITTIAPTFERLVPTIKRHWRKFILPALEDTNAQKALPYFLLSHEKDMMFTQRVGGDLKLTYEPEFPVTKFCQIPGPNEIVFLVPYGRKTDDEEFRQKIVQRAIELLPHEANAILLHGTSECGKNFTQYVSYYHVEIDDKPWYLLMPMKNEEEDWFTQHRADSGETFEPHHPVTKKTQIGPEMTIQADPYETHVNKWLFLAEVRRHMPKEANAVHIEWSGCLSTPVHYFAVKIDQYQAFDRLSTHRACFDHVLAICQNIGLPLT